MPTHFLSHDDLALRVTDLADRAAITCSEVCEELEV